MTMDKFLIECCKNHCVTSSFEFVEKIIEPLAIKSFIFFIQSNMLEEFI